VNFFDLLGIVAPVFLVLGVGFGLRRIRWMAPESDASVLKLGVNVLFPALILDTILGNPLLARPSVLWFPPLLAFLVIALSMTLVALLLVPFKLPRATVGAAVVTAGVQNFGYMVIPLVEALFDRETLGLLFVHNLGVEIAMWSIGVWVLTRGSGGALWKRLLSGPPVAILCSLLLNLLHAHEWLPVFVRKSLHMLGQASIPLALLLTGATIYDQVRDRQEGRAHYGALTLALVARVALLPLLILAIARWVPMEESLRKILVLQGAMPAAMMPVVICRLFQGDSRMSVQIILLSTAISLFTIPFWIKAGLWWITL
jgi:hypothetical protein